MAAPPFSIQPEAGFGLSKYIDGLVVPYVEHPVHASSSSSSAPGGPTGGGLTGSAPASSSFLYVAGSQVIHYHAESKRSIFLPRPGSSHLKITCLTHEPKTNQVAVGEMVHPQAGSMPEPPGDDLCAQVTIITVGGSGQNFKTLIPTNRNAVFQNARFLQEGSRLLTLAKDHTVNPHAHKHQRSSDYVIQCW